MEPKEIVYDICRYYLNDLTGVSPALFDKVKGYLRSRNLAGLTTCSRHFDSACHTVEDWRSLRQVEAFFKKNSAFSDRETCAETARLSFIEAERVCSDTNLRLKPFVRRPDLLDRDLYVKVMRMRRYISNVLGDFSPFLDSLPNLVRVTPGATANAKRKDSLPQLKMSMRTFASEGAARYVDALYRFYGFRSPRISDCPSNRVELVPKNWKTSRTIACEPEGNLPLQLAFDTYAKRRLRHFGINLSDQSANQRAAKHGSIHNNNVTVDFSQASDTIAYNAVQLVFPIDWLGYLNDVRVPCYRGVFGSGTYSKFSSMGNGSTFTIETLIFLLPPVMLSERVSS
jgi:hypothetical protein